MTIAERFAHGREAMEAPDLLLAADIWRGLIEDDANEPAWRWNLGQTLLALGDYKHGFAECTARRLIDDCPVDRALAEQGARQWRGEDLAGKSICLFNDMGYGDAIMMLRYVPMLTAADRVVLAVDKALHGLVAADNLVEVGTFVAGGFDYRCALFDLPLAFGAIAPLPYIAARKTNWIEPGGRRMGIAWSGRRSNQRDPMRSIPLAKFLDHFNCGGWQFYSLQVDGGQEASNLGVTAPLFQDFQHCASFMTQMDRIVTVDTAAAHLAGAIGHPDAHVVVYRAQHWPWYHVNEWYPTLKVHRQASAGDWASAFASVNAS